eukprot:6191970-Pleurochrysis_carterae.AAC.1
MEGCYRVSSVDSRFQRGAWQGCRRLKYAKTKGTVARPCATLPISAWQKVAKARRSARTCDCYANLLYTEEIMTIVYRKNYRCSAKSYKATSSKDVVIKTLRCILRRGRGLCLRAVVRGAILNFISVSKARYPLLRLLHQISGNLLIYNCGRGVCGVSTRRPL